MNPRNRRYRLSRILPCLLPLCGLGIETACAQIGDLEAIAAPMESVFLRWNDLTADESGFLVERRTGEGEYSELLTTPPDVTGFTDTGLEPATKYFYRVQPVNGSGQQAGEVEVTTFPQWEVPVPEVAISSPGGGDYTVSFPGQGATYTVEGSMDLNTWAPLEPPFYLDSTGQYTHTLPVGWALESFASFYRVRARAYERPPVIGLDRPFELPPEPDGEVYDVTQFGASPANIQDGNDDAIGIMVAISIAGAGDVVFIPAGTYTIRQKLVIPTGVTLRGAGMDQTLLVTEGIDRAVEVTAFSHDIRIEDFAITYLGETEELGTGVHVGSSRSGNNAYRIVIDGIRVEGFSVHGVSLRDCHHVLVRNCRMLNATNLGGGGHGYGIALNYPTNHNNWIRNNTIGPVIRHAILLQYYAHNNLVEHNLAVENSEDAYDLHGEDEYANELRYNTARDGARDGFGVGNTGATHDRSGPDNWIHHNTVERSLSGIEVIQGSDVVYIDQNSFIDNDYGIRVHDIGGRHLYLRGNLIDGNRVGVSLSRARQVWLLENQILNQTLYGIEILAGTEDLVESGNVLEGNALDYRP